jgi:FKBP-type peptidyl-prolyl cis-trans isomerase
MAVGLAVVVSAAAAGAAAWRARHAAADTSESSEEFVTLPSGLQYRVLRAGSGDTPTDRDIVQCHYRGAFLDGPEFDSSYERGRPALFRLSQVIKGMREALKMMPVGSKWELIIPPTLGYGERGPPRKPGAKETPDPSTPLVYEVELLALNPK